MGGVRVACEIAHQESAIKTDYVTSSVRTAARQWLGIEPVPRAGASGWGLPALGTRVGVWEAVGVRVMGNGAAMRGQCPVVSRGGGRAAVGLRRTCNKQAPEKRVKSAMLSLIISGQTSRISTCTRLTINGKTHSMHVMWSSVERATIQPIVSSLACDCNGIVYFERNASGRAAP